MSLGIDSLFHAIELALSGLSLFWMLRTKRALPSGQVALGVLAHVAVAQIFGRGMFGTMRLASWAVFVHAPLLALAACAVAARRAPRQAAALGLATSCVVAVGVDAFLVEPHAFEISRVRLSSAKLVEPLRIVVIADIQFDRFGDYERRVLASAVAERPDLVLFPGDYIQEYEPRERERQSAAFNAQLRSIGLAPRLGAFAVPGNVDPSDWPSLFAGIPVTPAIVSGTHRAGEVSVTTLSLEDSFDTLGRIGAAPGFHVVVGHAPDYALGVVEADLLVAGHTHGGQVRLPFLGPLVTLSRVPRAWAAGTTALDGGKTLVVSRGIGMERGAAPRLRFLCKPELVIIDVEPAR